MIGFVFELDQTMFLGLYTLVLLITFLTYKIKKVKLTQKMKIYRAAFIFYILSVIKLVFFPIRYFFEGHKSQISITDFFQLVPMETILKSIEFGNHIQIIGNILLLFPIPILFQFVFNKKSSFIKTSLLILLVSISIEMLQLCINLITMESNNVVDVDDLILNVIGGILGWFVLSIWNIFSAKYRND